MPRVPKALSVVRAKRHHRAKLPTLSRYSTYHFCIDMIVLRGDEQSEDLAGFAKTYHLRSFDGHSDECLQKTWPPEH